MPPPHHEEAAAILSALGAEVVDAGTVVLVAGHFDLMITSTRPHPGVHCDVLIDLTGLPDDAQASAAPAPFRVHIPSESDLIGLLRWIEQLPSMP